MQLPHDPTSGAARSIRTVCEFLVSAGWQVHVLAVAATEGPLPLSIPEWLDQCNVTWRSRAETEYKFSDRGVQYTVVDVGQTAAADARLVDGDRFDKAFHELLATTSPHAYLSYVGWRSELSRRRRAHGVGATVVYSPCNELYNHPSALHGVDHVFVESASTADIYRERYGARVDVLPPPIAARDAVAPVWQPTSLTFVNPTPHKGSTLVARIIAEFAPGHADVPIMVVTSRGSRDGFVKVAREGGIDLTSIPTLLFTEPVQDPWRILGVTKVLLMPSFIESSGRLAAEALLNGIPVVASDRGGLPETLSGAGFALQLPQGLTPSDAPPSAGTCSKWLEAVVQLFTDEEAFLAESGRARLAARRYEEPALIAAYDQWFSSIL